MASGGHVSALPLLSVYFALLFSLYEISSFSLSYLDTGQLVFDFSHWWCQHGTPWKLENAPILVLTLDWDRSEWIGLVPVQWKSVTDLALIRHSAPSFILSNAATAVISLCRHLLCNHGPRPRPVHTCSGQRSARRRLSAWSASITCPRHSAVSRPEIEQWTPVADPGLVNGRAKVKHQRREDPGTEGAEGVVRATGGGV